MGFANLFADGFSMAASNYLGTKAEHDDLHRLEAVETVTSKFFQKASAKK